MVRGFLTSEYIAVSKDLDVDWRDLQHHIVTLLLDHAVSGSPIQELPGHMAGVPDTEDEDLDVVVQIQELLETRIRPFMAQDGGDIVFKRFRDGIVYLQLKGACHGCPLSWATLKRGVENMLLHYVPQVLSVEQVMET